MMLANNRWNMARGPTTVRIAKKEGGKLWPYM
jgi:hypothetical protein